VHRFVEIKRRTDSMCKASIVADNTLDAKRGDQTDLGKSSHGFSQFQRPQDASSSTAMVTFQTPMAKYPKKIALGESFSKIDCRKQAAEN